MRSALILIVFWGYALPSHAGVIDGRIRNSFIGDIAVVPRFGLFIPSESGVDTALAVGGEARFQLYSVDEGLSAAAGFNYMVPSRPGSGQIVVLPIILNAVYEVFLEGQSTELFFSGGVGLYPWSASFQGIQDSGLSFGLQAGLGAEPKVGPGNVLAELSYSLARAQHGSRGSVDVGGLTVAVGYRLIF